MVLGVPISVRAPSWLSTEQATAALGAASGILFADYMGSMIVGRYALVGGTALAVSSLAKGVIGVGGFWAAGRLTGAAQSFAWLASVGAFASIALDVIKTYVWTGGEVAAARLRAAYRVPVPVRPVVRVAPPAVPPFVRRAETPSGEALGGF